MAEMAEIIKDILKLPPQERANIADVILSSLDQPDEKIDELWRKEVEKRVTAYKKRQTKTVTVQEIRSKYQK